MEKEGYWYIDKSQNLVPDENEVEFRKFADCLADNAKDNKDTKQLLNIINNKLYPENPQGAAKATGYRDHGFIDKENKISEWCKKYNVHYIENKYFNYHRKLKDDVTEVIILNY